MKWLVRFATKVFMVNFMYNRYVFTGEMPSDEERRKYL